MSNSQLKVALVHDYLREYGGAERVLEQLHKIYPQAPVYTAFYDPDSLADQAARFADWDIRQSKLTSLPFYKKLFSPYRVFAAWAFEQFDFSSYDVVISSTNAYLAKAIHTCGKTKHISYIHTPARALWGYSTRTNWKKNPLLRVGGELINVWMRYLDVQTAQRPDLLIANSQTTAQRIKKFYRREAQIVYPPVQMVEQVKKTDLPAASKRDYLLFVGRLVLSKHPELAVQISNELGYPLKVVGTGIMHKQLQDLAGPQVEFLGGVDDDKLRELYLKAKVLIFPAEDEDFGIVPIEAHACGVPVVAHFSGEPRFSVNNHNGQHVNSLALEDWLPATQKVWAKRWSPQDIAQTAQRYSAHNFKKNIQHLVKKVHS